MHSCEIQKVRTSTEVFSTSGACVATPLIIESYLVVFFSAFHSTNLLHALPYFDKILRRQIDTMPHITYLREQS